MKTCVLSRMDCQELLAEAGCDSAKESAGPEEWISVDRRLPETTGEYYCCFVTHMGTQKHCAILKFKSGYFWGADSQTREVTHWFSLPKPPEHAQKGK